MNAKEQEMANALKPFGWTCTPVFWERYYSDPWVFNLANAVEELTKRLNQDKAPPPYDWAEFDKWLDSYKP